MLLAPIGPRVISRYRRVTVPRMIRDRAHWQPGSVIELGVIDERSRIIGLRSKRTSLSRRRRSVPPRTRRVTEVGQVSIPQAVLARVELETLSRVYFVGLQDHAETVWLVPEDRLAMVGRRVELERLVEISGFVEERV